MSPGWNNRLGYAEVAFAIRTFSHRRFCASAMRLRASGVKFLFNGPEMGVGVLTSDGL